MHGVIVVDAPRRSKINQLDDSVLLVLKMNVLRLDVAVNNRVLVQVVDSGKKLTDDVRCLNFIEV